MYVMSVSRECKHIQGTVLVLEWILDTQRSAGKFEQGRNTQGYTLELKKVKYTAAANSATKMSAMTIANRKRPSIVLLEAVSEGSPPLMGGGGYEYGGGGE